LANLIRAELADLLEDRNVERRDWKEAETRSSWERDLERRSREEVEARLSGLLSQLESLLVGGARPQADVAEPQPGDMSLRTTISEARAQISALEAALERERARRLAEQETARQAEAQELQVHQDLERRCEEARNELERLRAEVQRMHVAQDSAVSTRSQMLRDNSSELRRFDDELRILRADNREFQAAAARDQRALKEADVDRRRLKMEIEQERRAKEEAEAKLRTAIISASAPAAPAAPVLRPALRSPSADRRESSVGRQNRCVRVQGAEFISAPSSPADAPSRPLRGRLAGTERVLAHALQPPPQSLRLSTFTLPSSSVGPRRPRGLLQQELALLPEDLLESLSVAIGEPLRDIMEDYGITESCERSLMMRLYVVMAELQDLSGALTSGPEFHRFGLFLERNMDPSACSGASSDGTRTPPEVLAEECRPHRLL